jgi:Caudovirus prohead serine protease
MNEASPARPSPAQPQAQRDGLTAQQAAIFAVVDHYHDATGEPCPGSYIARKLNITRQVVQRHLFVLHRKGWLRGPAAPATPARSDVACWGGVTKSHLPRPGGEWQIPPMAQRQAPPERSVSLPPLALRAALAPDSIDEEQRSVELVFSTGAPVERYDWSSDTRYLESLSMESRHVRLERLNAGGPLLDSHSAYSVSDMLGSVVRGSAVVRGKEGRARVRFSRRPEVAGAWQDVRDGVLTSVSVGYRVHKYEETAGEGNRLPERRAIDWEPYEISMVPMPADMGAHVRQDRAEATNPCEIVPAATRSADTPAPPEERTMPEDTSPSQYIVTDDPLAAPAPRPETPTEPNDRDRGVAAERERVNGIRLACMAARLPRAFETKLIECGKPLVECQGLVFEEWNKRDVDAPRQGTRGPDIRVGDEPHVHVRAGIEAALLYRVRPKTAGDKRGFELPEQGRPYVGLTLMRIAETYLTHMGIRTTAMGKMQIASLALGLETRTTPGMHTTSDFAGLLADVASKTLRRAYEDAPQTWLPIARRTTLPDFKPVKRLQIGEAPALLEVGEHGEYTFGTIGEGRETFQLATYGRRFAITRKALVNDDTDAFSRVPTLFGRAARNLESDLVWSQITDNPVMSDGIPLFAAQHNNLSPTADAISVNSIGAGRAAMRMQKGVDGTTLLNITPQYLAVPAAKETIADQFVSTALVANTTGQINPFAGRLAVIAEPRLDADSTTAWYLIANPESIDVIECAYVEGEEGPMV